MPIRTCLVTGQKLKQEQLLRFTVQNKKIVFDPTDFEIDGFEVNSIKGTGRGGYVIPDNEAIGKLSKMKGKIEHFLKCKIK